MKAPGLLTLTAVLLCGACGKSSVPRELFGTYWRENGDKLSLLKVTSEGMRYADSSKSVPLVNPLLFDSMTCSSKSACSFTSENCTGSIDVSGDVKISIYKYCAEFGGTWHKGPPPRHLDVGCNDLQPQFCFDQP